MYFRIEDIRKSLSCVTTWLTFDTDTRFFKDERNIPKTENSKNLTRQLEIYTIKSRKLFNELSESLEDVSGCRKSLRFAIERDKEMRKKQNGMAI